jgi:DNA-binding XRE family transcriptional regulator
MRSILPPSKKRITLHQYRARYGVTYTHLARLCEVSPVTMRNIASGFARPSEELAARIEIHTGGLVPAASLLASSKIGKV